MIKFLLAITLLLGYPSGYLYLQTMKEETKRMNDCILAGKQYKKGDCLDTPKVAVPAKIQSKTQRPIKIKPIPDAGQWYIK